MAGSLSPFAFAPSFPPLLLLTGAPSGITWRLLGLFLQLRRASHSAGEAALMSIREMFSRASPHLSSVPPPPFLPCIFFSPRWEEKLSIIAPSVLSTKEEDPFPSFYPATIFLPFLFLPAHRIVLFLLNGGISKQLSEVWLGKRESSIVRGRERKSCPFGLGTFLTEEKEALT